MSNISALATAQALLRHQKEIEERWALSVKEKVKHASELEDPILYNYFPDLIQNIAEVLDPTHPRLNILDGSTTAQEHGGERARLTRYNIQEVAQEFHLLVSAIVSCLSEKIELTRDDLNTIHECCALALQQSIMAFALAESYLREQFIAMLAHDIRGPIAFIRMAAQVLLNGVDDANQADIYRRISHNADEAGRLIDNILDASLMKADRRIKLDIQQLDIMQIVSSVVQNWKTRIRLQGTSIIGHWCPHSLTRLLNNLLENAVKYGDPNQAIDVAVHEEHDAVVISVHNEGSAIPFDQQETIFQPFQRSHAFDLENVKGWGFGLPIVRGIAESHGGSIGLDSAPGRGTTFTIKLPIDARPYQHAPTLE